MNRNHRLEVPRKAQFCWRELVHTNGWRRKNPKVVRLLVKERLMNDSLFANDLVMDRE